MQDKVMLYGLGRTPTATEQPALQASLAWSHKAILMPLFCCNFFNSSPKVLFVKPANGSAWSGLYGTPWNFTAEPILFVKVLKP